MPALSDWRNQPVDDNPYGGYMSNSALRDPGGYFKTTGGLAQEPVTGKIYNPNNGQFEVPFTPEQVKQNLIDSEKRKSDAAYANALGLQQNEQAYGGTQGEANRLNQLNVAKIQNPVDRYGADSKVDYTNKMESDIFKAAYNAEAKKDGSDPEDAMAHAEAALTSWRKLHNPLPIGGDPYSFDFFRKKGLDPEQARAAVTYANASGTAPAGYSTGGARPTQATPTRQVVQTGKDKTGRTVYKYSDGSIGY